MLDKFAEYLREARLKNGATIQQIGAKTRIDIKFLEAIDSGNFGFLPDLYVKAFLKRYAKAIGLDENDTIKKYEEALEGKFVGEEEPKSLLEQKVEISSPQPEPKGEKPIPIYDGSEPLPQPDTNKIDIQKVTKILVYSIGIIVVGVAVFFAFFNRSSTIVVEEPPYEKVLEETKERYQVPEDEQAATDKFNTDSLTLQIVNADSVDSAWVMIIYDDLVKEDFLLYPKNAKTVYALDNFKFTLGNSGVILLKLDDKILNFEGRRGSVRHYEVTRDSIQRLNSPPVLKIE
jgi:transcriptional regulator with XRE-family HTH domain